MKSTTTLTINPALQQCPFDDTGLPPAKPLIATDYDELVCRTIAQILEGDGHLVFKAGDVEVGFPEFLELSPDADVTDVFMPNMPNMPNRDGSQIILAARELRLGVKTTAMSGGGKTGDIGVLDTALIFGADVTLRKLFTIRRLRTIPKHCADAGSSVC